MRGKYGCGTYIYIPITEGVKVPLLNPTNKKFMHVSEIVRNGLVKNVTSREVSVTRTFCCLIKEVTFINSV